MSKSSFHQLLFNLQVEHDREVGSLRARLSQCQCGSLQVDAGMKASSVNCEGPPSPKGHPNAIKRASMGSTHDEDEEEEEEDDEVHRKGRQLSLSGCNLLAGATRKKRGTGMAAVAAEGPTAPAAGFLALLPADALRDGMTMNEVGPGADIQAKNLEGARYSQSSEVSAGEAMKHVLSGDSSTATQAVSTPQKRPFRAPKPLLSGLRNDDAVYQPVAPSRVAKGSILKHNNERMSTFSTCDAGNAKDSRRFSKGVSFDRFSVAKADTDALKMVAAKPRFAVRKTWDEPPTTAEFEKSRVTKMASRKFGSLSRAANRLSTLGHSVVHGDLRGANPNDFHQFVWDYAAFFLVAFDLIVIPLEVFPGSWRGYTFYSATTLLTTLFWWIDFARAFFVGYYLEGEVVQSLKMIRTRYAKSWLLPDLIININQAVLVGLNLANDDAQNAASFAWPLFSLRLLRVLKLGSLITRIEDRINSEENHNLQEIARSFVFLIFLNHFIACGWYLVGSLSILTFGEGWLQQIDNRDFIYLYTTSFHWSLTQFTPASIAVQPQNPPERIFAILVLVGALVIVSSFISGITGAMMHLRSLSSVKSKKFWMLRRYLSETQIPVPLAVRVRQFCENAYISRDWLLKEQSVEVLELLSVHLRTELSFAIFSPRLSMHPLMVLIEKKDLDTFRRLCGCATARLPINRDEVLFDVGEEATRMYFIINGTLEYQMQSQEFKMNECIGKDTWVCEAVLWTTWTYMGCATAKVESEVVSLDAAKFSETMRTSPDMCEEATTYARNFVQGLNRQGNENITDLYLSTAVEGLHFRLLNEFNWHASHCERGGHASTFGSTFGGHASVFGSVFGSSGRRSEPKGDTGDVASGVFGQGRLSGFKMQQFKAKLSRISQQSDGSEC